MQNLGLWQKRTSLRCSWGWYFSIIQKLGADYILGTCNWETLPSGPRASAGCEVPSATLGISAGNSFEVHCSFTINSILDKGQFFTSGAAAPVGSMGKCSLCSSWSHLLSHSKCLHFLNCPKFSIILDRALSNLKHPYEINAVGN